MEEILVQSSTNTYKISIGESLRLQIKQFLNKEYSSIMLVTDDHVAALYLNEILENLPNDQVFQSIVPAGEKSKNLQAFYQLQTEAIEFGLDRESLIIALGGGVVGDLAGFVAATYMRGIDYIQMPTTILAHDSSVGGKVAINHELGKNLIGSFYPPEAVIYDVETLHSLSDREIRSGYAELIKEALISNENFFNTLLMVDIYNVPNGGLQAHLQQGIKIKATIVEADERESGVRKYLNLGHTLGHALEAELGYGKLTHGEAVAIGLLFAIHVSEELYSIKLPFNELVQWFTKNKYPINVTDLDKLALINKMKSDKKALKSRIQMVLLEAVAKPVTKELEDTAIENYLISFERRLMEND
ncbi:3-dehydroquinate synthase [Oceanobacillus sp. FSL K6-2867]|uniref:3-dehydroquinate synthase n=1 Tax=Oceanobacillus sp. FSL K6-2867 TaxID=2954748 RepID=UPI0030D931A0